MQWMIMTSVVPCHALHAPQHATASPFVPLNHSNDFFRPSCRSRLYITDTGKSRYAGFYLELTAYSEFICTNTFYNSTGVSVLSMKINFILR